MYRALWARLKGGPQKIGAAFIAVALTTVVASRTF